jgi:hypothetical protein
MHRWQRFLSLLLLVSALAAAVPAAEPDRGPAPAEQPTPLAAALAAVFDESQQRGAELAVRFTAATAAGDQAEALVVQAELAALKSGTERRLSDVQAEFARREGRLDANSTASSRSLLMTDRRTLPDMTPAWLAGWYAPLVPRPGIGTYPPPAPDALYGNTQSTYPYMAVVNAGAGATPAFGTDIAVDGEVIVSQYLPQGLLPYDTWVFIAGSATAVGGGRHTFTMQIDPMAQVEEANEANNVYGEQWVWSPLDLSPGVPELRTAPPEMLGGWDHATSGEPLYYNCDGLRLPPGPGYWTAVAVMPGAATDVDLRLHEYVPGVKNGFAVPLVASYWNAGQSDFVLVNFNRTMFAPYDVGAYLYGGQENYQAEATTSLTFSPNDPGPYGPWQMGPGRILDLREFYLTPGQWSLSLDNLAGVVDWGVSVHPADVVFQGKSTTLPEAVAWLQGPGQSEQVTFTVPASDWYGVAVWKVASDDLPLTGTYRLRLDSGLTAAPDAQALPAVCALTNIWPNPFNPQTTVEFDLAADLPVRLTIHDVRGVCVRTLVDAQLPRGRQTVVWDGRDNGGQSVASGIYMVRFAAGDIHEMRKVTLLK